MTSAILDGRGVALTPTVDPFEAAISQAVQQGNLDALRELYAFQKEVKADRAREDYDAAFSEMQAELPVIEHTKRVEFFSKRLNKKVFKNTYTPWEDIDAVIRPIYTKYGFSLSFEYEQPDNGPIEITAIFSRGGHSRQATVKLPPDMGGEKNASQGVASSLTFGKRYAAGAVINFVTKGAGGESEDDDGEQSGRPLSAHAARKTGTYEQIKAEMRARCSTVDELQAWWKVIQCDQRFLAWPKAWRITFKSEDPGGVDAYRNELIMRSPV